MFLCKQKMPRLHFGLDTTEGVIGYVPSLQMSGNGKNFALAQMRVKPWGPDRRLKLSEAASAGPGGRPASAPGRHEGSVARAGQHTKEPQLLKLYYYQQRQQTGKTPLESVTFPVGFQHLNYICPQNVDQRLMKFRTENGLTVPSLRSPTGSRIY